MQKRLRYWISNPVTKMTQSANLLWLGAGIAVGDGPRKPIQCVRLWIVGIPLTLVIRHVWRRQCSVVLASRFLMCCRACENKMQY